MSKMWEPPADRSKTIGAKSHFVISPWGNGYAVTIRRRGHPLETILVDTAGEANRIRLKLSGEGLIGFMEGCL